MKHKLNNGKKAASILSGKGFYISLAVCLAAIGTTAFFAVSRTGDILNKTQTMDLSSAVVSANEWGFPQNANAPESGVEASSSEARRLRSRSSSSSGSSVKKDGAQEQENSSGSSQTLFAMPVSGEVLQSYSKGELVKSSTMNDWRTHDGVDISAKLSTPVKAAADGTVTAIVDDALWGVVVQVDHKDGYVARYCGLSKTVNVKKGQDVKMGDVLGAVGDTSLYETNDRAHLHFELMRDDSFINPMSVLKK